MRPYRSRPALDAVKSSRPPLPLPVYTAVAKSILNRGPKQFRGLLTLAVLFPALLLAKPGKLFAQQTQPGDQSWSQNDLDVQQPYSDSGQSYPQRGYGQTPSAAQPLNAAQLEQLVAPIALYPDTLVAQVLAASTYSGQVADADRWLHAQGYSSSDQIAAGADVQNWDPSVKALTAFPRVLAQMDRNLQWTTDLGNAYYNQPQDVLEAVQVMRRRAQAAGTLQSTPQETVRYDQDYIQVMPANPQVVYVPTYNPWTVYGEQVSPYPGFSLLGAVESFLGSSPINYGLGIVMSAFSHTPWGWLAWGLNWLTQSVLFDQSDFYSQSTTVADWGFRHDMHHAYAERGGFGRHGWDHSAGGFRRFSGGYNGNRGQGFGRSPQRFAENWRGGSNRGFHAFGSGYDRTPRQAYSHFQTAQNRVQFDRGRGSSPGRWAGGGFRGGTGASNYRSMPDYRAQSSGLQRGAFGGRSSGVFGSRDFAHSVGKPARSGGPHLFGGGHTPRSIGSHGSGGFHMGGRGHAPKSFQGGGKSFGGGHSHGGGGRSGGHGGGRHHR